MKKVKFYDVWDMSDRTCLSRGVEAADNVDAILKVTGVSQIAKTTQKDRGRTLYTDGLGKVYLSNKLPRHPDEMFCPN